MIPDFKGWRPLKKGEFLKETDRFVLLKQDMDPGRAATPEKGEPIGRYVGHYADEWTDAFVKYWMPYRRVETNLPRRLFMNKGFSQPLPLP